MSKVRTVTETSADVVVKPEAVLTDQQPDDAGVSPGTASVHLVTDVDSELSYSGSEPNESSTASDKPAPKITYETVEGELRETAPETENQETSDNGRTITRRVKTVRYYQPVIHRTLADGVVINETTEDVLVGSYVDEYCFDAPLDMVDVYSASVETQTSVDESEQTLDDGTWLRRKLTRVVAYLAVDDDDPENITDIDDGPLRLAAGTDQDLLSDSKLGHETKTDVELQNIAPYDQGLESRTSIASTAEHVLEQATMESTRKPVDTVLEPDMEHVQEAQLESDQSTIQTLKLSTDISDLTSEVETSSVIVERAPDYTTEHAVVVSYDEQMTTQVSAPSESTTAVQPGDTSIQPTENEELVPVAEETIMAEPNPRQERARPTMATVSVTSSVDELEEFPLGEELIEEQHTREQCDLEPVSEETIIPKFPPSKESKLETVKLDFKSETTVSASEACVPCATVTEKDEAVIEKISDFAADAPEAEVAPAREEKLIMAVPDLQQERDQPVATTLPLKTPEELTADKQLMKEAHTTEQFATPVCDLTPAEDFISADVPAPKDLPENVEQSLGQTVTDEKSKVLSKIETVECTEVRTTVTRQESTLTTDHSGPCQAETAPVTEEQIVAVPNPRQERSRLVMTGVHETTSFDEPEELIEECSTVEQFATPVCDLKPVEEDIIAPEVRPPKDSKEKVEQTLDQTVTDKKSEMFSKEVVVGCTEDRTRATLQELTLSADKSDLFETETAPIAEELIVATPNHRQERSRPVVTSVQESTSFDEPEELIEERSTVEQFAAPACDLKPVEEDLIAPEVRSPKESKEKVEQTLDQTVTDKKSEMFSKEVVVECTEDRTRATLQELTLSADKSDLFETETAPIAEELIVATPNPRQERSRSVVTSVQESTSFDEPEELIEECSTVEQFAAPACDLKPVEEDLIAPEVRPPKESKEKVEQTLDQTLTDKKSEMFSKEVVVECTEERTRATLQESTLSADQSALFETKTAPVAEEQIVATPNPRQEKSRAVIRSVQESTSFDEPEELIEECQTVEQFATPACDLKPVEEDIIAPHIRPLRTSSVDSATLRSDIKVAETVDKTPFVPVEKIVTSDHIQPALTDARDPTSADQQRTRPVLVLKYDGDTKTAPGAPTLPPRSTSRQPRRPHSATEFTHRRYGIESPQPGIHSKPRMRRESPLSFVDRFTYPASPTLFGVDDLASPLFDDGRRQVKTRSKKLITRKVRKVRHDGEVVEDIVTEEVPVDYGYSDTSSVRSGQSPAAISPRTPSVSSLTSPLPLEPMSPGADSLSSQSSLRVFTDTVESEPEVVTDVQEREETLPDGRVVIRKIIRTRQKQTIVKRTVMEGPSTDDEQPTTGSGPLVAAGEDVQKPDIWTYSDAMEMKPTTETTSKNVEEVLPDGTVVKKSTTTTSTRQLKTDRKVVEGPYVPETVHQVLQGDAVRPSETAVLPQSPGSHPSPTATKSGGPSRQPARPKFRISMESPPPPPPPPTASDDEGAADTSHPRSTGDQVHRPT